MRRIFLFLLTNVLVMATIAITASVLLPLLGFQLGGRSLGGIMAFALIAGFSGAGISLLLSKPMAKWSTGTQLIDPSQATREEQWLLATVRNLADKAGIGMPEVGVYDGEANAFATGANRNNALVAVSTGLLNNMTKAEIEAVLAHEIAHVANGDMITLTLVQGVVNTFSIFLARVIGWVIDVVVLKNEDGPGIGYMVSVVVLDILFSILGSLVVMKVSRMREFKADEGSAKLLGSPQPMIQALARLNQIATGQLPSNMQAMGISGGMAGLFRTHPTMEERIKYLRALND